MKPRSHKEVLDYIQTRPNHLWSQPPKTEESFFTPRSWHMLSDAMPYDEGDLSPEDISGKVQIQGRGGTVLQPAVAFLLRQTDFPKDGSILIITDDYCDELTVKRPHAYLMETKGRLPRNAKGEIFRIT